MIWGNGWDEEGRKRFTSKKEEFLLKGRGRDHYGVSLREKRA